MTMNGKERMEEILDKKKHGDLVWTTLVEDKMMKAIIVQGPREIEMIEVEKPKPGPEDILASVSYTGICGTDLAIYSGDMKLIRDGSIRYPVRIGHEWSGVVESVGQNVTQFKPGDRVISETSVSCGKCIYCLCNDYNACESVRSLGTVNCWDGSFAEYMLMPERHVYKLPDEISLEEGALIEPAAIALAGVKQCNIRTDSKILIIGTGSIGLSAIPLAKALGAEKVIVSGRKSFKLDIARQMGADVTINVTSQNQQEIVMEETSLKGVDAIIETSGNIDVIDQLPNLLRTKGIIALIGFYEKNLTDFNIDAYVMKSAHIKGILGEFGMPQEVIKMRMAGKFSLKPLITHLIDFNEAIDVIRTANERIESKIKILVRINRTDQSD